MVTLLSFLLACIALGLVAGLFSHMAEHRALRQRMAVLRRELGEVRARLADLERAVGLRPGLEVRDMGQIANQAARAGQEPARPGRESALELEELGGSLDLEGLPAGPATASPPAGVAAAARASEQAAPDGMERVPRAARDAAPPRSATDPVSPGPESASPQPPASGLDALRRFLVHGNPMARMGMLLLFVGIAFLLKYTAGRIHISLEACLALVGAAGLALLGLGWLPALRRTQRVYALILQGGGTGILYLTAFAAARIFHLLPFGLVLGLMSVLVLLAGASAVLQNALPLALMASVGGFLAPILMSTGKGSHVALFAYYALLNAGIAGMAWFRAWRSLNLTGFLFTFVIAALWGSQAYVPEMFSTTEPFLLLFLGFYIGIAILFALRSPPDLRGVVDGTLVFGVPLITLALHVPLVRNFPHGMAWTCLGMGLLYVGLAVLTRRREALALLGEAFAAIGLCLLSLAIPLALSPGWISAAWALEAVGIYFVGARQQRPWARIFALLLQAGAGYFFVSDPYPRPGDMAVINQTALGFLLLSAGSWGLCLCGDRILGRDRAAWERTAALLVFWTGCIWWIWGGLHETGRFVPPRHLDPARLLFFTLSALGASLAGRRLRWPRPGQAAALLLPGAWAVALGTVTGPPGWHLLQGLGALAWPLALAVHVLVLRREERQWPGGLVRTWHVLGLWLLLLVCAHEAAWAGERLVPGHAGLWSALGAGLVPALLLAALHRARPTLAWPLERFAAQYLAVGTAVPAACLGLWHLLVNLLADPASPLPYLPLANPLELAQFLLAGLLYLWGRWLQGHVPDGQARPPWRAWGDNAVAASVLLAVAALHASLARAVHVYARVAYAPAALWDSFAFQCALSVFWGVLALGLTVTGHRLGRRFPWIAGCSLLVLEVCKLLIKDLAGTGSLWRIVSFMAVGLIMLAIGYLAPLPPGAGNRGEETGEKGEGTGP